MPFGQRDAHPDAGVSAQAGLRPAPATQSAVGQVVGGVDQAVPGRQLIRMSASSFSRARSTLPAGRPPRKPCVDVGPFGAAELVPGVTQQVELRRTSPVSAIPGVRPVCDVVDDAQHADYRGGQDRDGAGLVVEAHIAAGHRDAQLLAAVGQSADRFGELPHDSPGSSGEPKFRQLVTASGRAPAGGDVAVGLSQRELRPGVRVEPGVAAVAVDRERDARGCSSTRTARTMPASSTAGPARCCPCT